MAETTPMGGRGGEVPPSRSLERQTADEVIIILGAFLGVFVLALLGAAMA